MTGLETALTSAAIKEGAGPAASFAAKFGKEKYHRFVVEYCRCFDEHVKASYRRCKYVKNILYRDNSVELLNQYVHVSFKKGNETATDQDISTVIRETGKLIVSGTAGAGKTMFMKWLTLDLIEGLAHHQRIPLFLELRYITKEGLERGLLNYILDYTSAAEKRVSLDRFKIGLEMGQFILVLDAVDEVSGPLRDKVVDEIRSLVKDYPACPVLLSSRPDDELESLQELSVYRTNKMNEDQIVEVITKIDFDLEVKQRLIEKLRNGLFVQHEEFLSNPLLATIMLLNFDHSADIPTRLTSFYRQAFEALYQRHDAAKGAYRRGHFAGLPLDEYEKVFSAFCFDSFLDSKVQFSDSELLDYFRSAAQYYGINSEPTLLVQDAMKSVCVIQREGLDNVFAHRSFQEYFTALFLSRYREDDFADQIQDTVLGWRNSNVLKMLLEIAPEAVEQLWMKPKIDELYDKIRRIRPTTFSGANKVFTLLFSTIKVNVDNGMLVGFSSSSFPDVKHAGGWLSAVGMAYSPPIPLSRSVFSTEPIFTSLEEYLATIKDGPTWEQVSSRFDEDDDDEKETRTMDLYPDDLPWLMQSGLPTVLRRVRDNIGSFHKELGERIHGRGEAMARLRTRRFGGNLVRRGRAKPAS